MKLPDFLIIGAMKAGTTTLFRDLDAHPRIFFPQDKEPSSLCHESIETKAGLQDYERLFVRSQRDQVRGEASTAYSKLPLSEGVAARARRVLGRRLKAIYIVRNPVTRIISHHRHLFALGEASADINESVRADPQFLDYSRYAMQLSPWMKELGRANIHIVIFEEMIERRSEVVGDAMEFLGVERREDLVDSSRAHNRSEDKPVDRGAWLTVTRSAPYRRVLRPLLSRSMREKLRELLLPSAPSPTIPLSADTAVFIADALSAESAELARLLGRDTPVWSRDSMSSAAYVSTPLLS